MSTVASAPSIQLQHPKVLTAQRDGAQGTCDPETGQMGGSPGHHPETGRVPQLDIAQEGASSNYADCSALHTESQAPQLQGHPCHVSPLLLDGVDRTQQQQSQVRSRQGQQQQVVAGTHSVQHNRGAAGSRSRSAWAGRVWISSENSSASGGPGTQQNGLWSRQSGLGAGS